MKLFKIDVLYFLSKCIYKTVNKSNFKSIFYITDRKDRQIIFKSHYKPNGIYY